MHEISNPIYQIVIASVPWTDSDSPLLAPAVLKSNLQQVGIGAIVVDLNAEIRHLIANTGHENDVIQFFLTEQIKKESKDKIKSVIDYMANRLLDYKSEWIALSLLSYLSQITTRWLCFRIKQINPDAKIVIGGPGASVSLKSTDSFATNLLKNNLIDYFITGDGEESLPALIKGQTNFPGINSENWRQIENINVDFFPDFDDYNWSLYKNKQIPIVGSRGCVRSCTFCDIHEHWDRYQFRTGENIFHEIRTQYEKYGIDTFMFSDSLVNGNQKEFRILIRLLADFNQSLGIKPKIRWSGSFIVRPKDQMKEDDWYFMSQSGCSMLSVGIESFVEHIRYHIGKKFTNEDIENILEMGQKYHINMIFLMIVGYVTETDDDFEEALQWIRNHKQYANNPIYSVQIGSGLGILPGTWLHRNLKKLNIQIKSADVMQDWYSDETQSTPQKRMNWHERMKQELEANGFNVAYLKDNHVIIEKYFNDKYQNRTVA